MSRRRKAREVALQFLYQLDLQGDNDPAPHAVDFWAQHPLDDDAREFADDLVRGAMATHANIDDVITRFTEHWDLDRMAVVDRNILRLAVYELARPGRPRALVLAEGGHQRGHRDRQEVRYP